MQFEQGHIYHIYNQGNNRQRIFFERENYLFFLNKMREYLLPYCDILAWCLMPNHFHWMVMVTEIAVTSEGVTQSDALTNPFPKQTQRTLNDSIGLLLRSYTRAINKQQNKSGSLFRKETKAECLTKLEGITLSFYNTATGTQINTHFSEEQYPQICFDYIHQNPVNARLVKKAKDWEFSSYPDYYTNRKGTLINKEAAQKYIVV